MRLQQSLLGLWEFGIDPEGTQTHDNANFSRQIEVPMPWQAAVPDLQEYSGYAWYRRSVELSEDWLDGQVLLRFGAVDYWCRVFVNGAIAGEHEGGYMPFTLAVGEYLRPGANTIVVQVYDSAQEGIFIPRWRHYDAGGASDGPPFNAEDVPHGKQEWYINAGGIWQDVTLMSVPRVWIEHVQVTPHLDGRVEVEIEVGGQVLPGEEAGKISIAIADAANAQTEVMLQAGKSRYAAAVSVAEPRLWSTEDPFLYTLSAELSIQANGREQSDSQAVRFGFRTFRSENGRFFLNNEPIYLLSALDQDLYPDTIYTVPSEEFLRDQFTKAKELGLNCLRCHIKPPDPVYLDLADEMGLLVWTEIPSWRTFYVKGTLHPEQRDLPESVQARVEQTLREMIKRDFNHASIVIWTIVNEDWGTTLPLSAADKSWVKEMYDLCKHLDPTRMVVDNSACPHPWGPNIHVRSDIDDFHFYANIPDQASSWEATCDQFGLRPVWTYSSHGEASRTGDEPLVLSEFGNWGLPRLSNLLKGSATKEPAWFGIGPWWSTWEGEPGWPSGVEERFHCLGLDAIWGSYDEFAEATQWHQYAALKFEIEALRRQPGIAGYVITELADIYWESNGLLDFYRNLKVYHALFSRFNAQDVIVPRIAANAYWDDEQVTVRLYLSLFSAEAVQYGSELKLRWSLGSEEGVLPVRSDGPGVTIVGAQRWKLPTTNAAGMMQAALWLEAADGARLAENSIDMVVYPAAQRRAGEGLRVAVVSDREADMAYKEVDPSTPEQAADSSVSAVPDTGLVDSEALTDQRSPNRPSLASLVRRVGYDVVHSPTSGVDVAVSDYPSAELLAWVREGGDLLFVSSGPSPFFWVQPRGGAYSGAWLTSFSWIRPEVHTRLHVQNPLGLPFRNVMPTGTILGLPMEDQAVQKDILAGMVSGWVGNPAAHTVQFRYGKGRVIMTTFRLRDCLGSDPVATAMFHDLLSYLRSDRCQPTLTANF